MGVNRVYLTEAGARIAMYCQHNDMAVDFTKFGVGDGENLNPETAVAMIHEVTTFNVNRVKGIGAGNYRVSGDMPNTALSADLTYRELCLYAVDPETDSEVMYCYGNAKGADFDFTEIIPAFDTSSAYSSRKFEIDLFLENDRGANITVKVDNVESSLIADLSNDYEELRHDVEGLLEGMETRKFQSSSAYPSWLLIADVSSFFADNAGGKPKQGFTGFAVIARGGGILNGEGMTRLTACVSGQNKTDGNDDSTVCLKTETPDIKPRIVTYNGKHYIAIEITGASHDVILCGMWEGCLDKVITLINTDATTKPVGLQVVEFSDYFTVYGSESAKTLDTSLNVNGWTTDTDTAENWSSKKTCLWYF